MRLASEFAETWEDEEDEQHKVDMMKLFGATLTEHQEKVMSLYRDPEVIRAVIQSKERQLKKIILDPNHIILEDAVSGKTSNGEDCYELQWFGPYSVQYTGLQQFVLFHV